MAADVNTVDATDAGSDSCLDSRGIRRGKCTAEKCSCNKYDGGKDRKKCVSCNHPPGKHSNLDKTDSNGHKLAECAADDCKEPVFTDYHGVPFEYCSPECRDKDLLVIHHLQLDADIAYRESLLRQLTPIPIPLHHQSECRAEGCKNYVYTDYHGVPFEYCSPECRDKHLRVIHQQQLDADIADKESLLRQLPPISIPHHQSENSRKQHEESLGRCTTERNKSKSPSPVHLEKHNKSISPTPKGSSKGGKSKSKKPKNPCKEVELKRDSDGSCGIIVSNQLFQENDQICGLLVTGVKIDSKALKDLQDGKIQFCDTIVKVNGEPVTEEMCASAQDKLYDILSRWPGDSVKLLLYRPAKYYPADVSAKAISVLRSSTENTSHIIDVIHPYNLNMAGSKSGMSITDTNILNITEMSLSYTCGMRDEDEFLGSVIPCSLNKLNQSLITCKQHDKIKDRISNASDDIILAIRRK